ncbi:peptidylprolyl isomerase [Chlamydiales bacterium]|nr:peptidylprolyl isomerase [Chlamydiales bacterium]
MVILPLFMGFMLLYGYGPIREEKNMGIPRPIVVFETTQGNIEFELRPDLAPKTTENFIKLIQENYYNGIIFHRIIESFMVQGGDPTGTGAGGESVWGKPFEDEFSDEVSFDQPGVLAMANRGPNTNGSQFFITTVPTPWLNQKHTIFGMVKNGYDSVQKLENVKKGPQDRPIETQKIIKAYLKNDTPS